MEKVIGSFELNGEQVNLVAEKFRQGKGLAIVMVADDETPYGRLSVNLPTAAHLLQDERECFVKTYFENEPIVEPVLATGVIRPTGRSGDGYPIWRLDDSVVIS
ncbi:hypothetical protein WT83_19310 [Burkholderia territorii]|uniref:Uncharacterized protein n=1 Tax=Burkholderia territorii TaxID=1503055 RepID=A0A108EI77_9BURK|nr:hypothetical protein [Burkholderia territorii]KWN11741.1 hypothetical protein WT83_19310 [Burkholderia territorii]